MKPLARIPVVVVCCGVLATVGGVAGYAASDDGAPSTSSVPSVAPAGHYVYRSAIQSDVMNVRDLHSSFAPYSVASKIRLQTWTAPDGSTLTRQTCLSVSNADSQSGESADPSKGQACQSLEFRMSRSDLSMDGLLDGADAEFAARLTAAAGAGTSPVQVGSLAASVALNPASTEAQRKAAETVLGNLPGAIVKTLPDGAQSVEVTGPSGSVNLEFNTASGDVTSYRESLSVRGSANQPTVERRIDQVATVGTEGEVPAHR